MTKFILRAVSVSVVLVVLGGGSAEAACPEGAGAKREYLRAWAAVHGRLDAPLSPAPRLARRHEPRPGNLAWISANLEGFREIRVGDGLWAMLGGRQGCKRQRAALVVMVHEFAHIYQSDPIFAGETPLTMPLRVNPWWGHPGEEESTYDGITEGLAQAWAEWVAREDLGLIPADYRIARDEYDAYADEMREATTPAFIRRGQFGYLGSSRSIPLPGWG